ncbi:HAD family hydrolase [Spiribacter onubensis]|uniref:HAD family hydrolase n=1 Tax=Spiribacter onubensis TaxID=3122420 RepID=A0ABV3S8K3_9GAMM
MSANAPLVIFDCDGVLVDSEPLSLAVTQEVLGELGCDLSEADGYRYLLGRSLGHVVDWLREARGLALEPSHRAAIHQRLMDRLASDLQGIPHIAGVVGALEGPVCVASSSALDRVRHSLEVTGLLPLFEPNLFTASMVARGKPEPDLFLYAAREMGCHPEHCIVVEDSPAGLDAAHAAGMRVIAFVGGSHARPAGLHAAVANHAPMAIISDMRELPAVLSATA